MVSLPKTIEIAGLLSLVETEGPHVLLLLLWQMSDLHTLQSSPQPDMASKHQEDCDTDKNYI